MYPDTLANVLSTWQQLHSPNNRESSPGRGLNMVRLRGHSSYARERRGRERTTRGQGFRRITSRNNSSIPAAVVRASVGLCQHRIGLWKNWHNIILLYG